MNTLPLGNAWSHFTQAPLQLRAYIVFVLVAMALSFSGFYAPALDRALVPYTGWSTLNHYMFTLFFAISAIGRPPRNIPLPFRKQVYAVVWLLGFIVLVGLYDTYLHTIGALAGRTDHGNPYLMYSPLRPIITVLLPTGWLLLFLSPAMRKWTNRTGIGD